ncbi:MAG: hypothetical protein QM479_01040 [Pseudomonadota bacterium]
MSNNKKILMLILALSSFLYATTSIAKITPSDVYAKLDLADQHLDSMLDEKGLKMSEQLYIEKKLKPMHVYQMIMACTDMLRKLQIKEGLRPFPIMAVAPMKYSPADVLLLVEILEQQIKRVTNIQQLEPDSSLLTFFQKTPTDVFNKSMDVFIKLRLILGKKNISPNVAYAQMSRAVSDAEYILINIDKSSRYQINAPQSQSGLNPTDVFKISLKVRRTLNKVRKFYQMPSTSVPAFDGKKKSPQDVYYQTQIIIAELNLIKLASFTTNITPIAIKVTGKKPSDVHQQANYINYLMAQVDTLTNIVQSNSDK